MLLSLQPTLKDFEKAICVEQASFDQRDFILPENFLGIDRDSKFVTRLNCCNFMNAVSDSAIEAEPDSDLKKRLENQWLQVVLVVLLTYYFDSSALQQVIMGKILSSVNSKRLMHYVSCSHWGSIYQWLYD